MYLESLHDNASNVITRPISGIIIHLSNTYRNITSEKIVVENEKVATYQFDPTEPVDVIYAKIENLQTLADAGQAPYTQN